MYTGTYKLGIGLIGGSGLSIDDHIALLKNIGWDAFFTSWHPQKTPLFAQAAKDHGMVYSSIHAPFDQMAYLWNEGDLGVQVTNNLIDCLKDCATHHIPVMVLHPFIGFGEESPTEAGLVNFARLVDKADKLGIRLGFENVEGESYLAAIFERFASHPSLGFCFDTGHELCYNRGKDMLALYGHKLCHTHFNDNMGVTGNDIFWTDDLHLVMGDGIANWPDIMRRIRGVDYDGILTCELKLPKDTAHERYAQMGHREFYAFVLEKMRAIAQMQ